MIIFIKEAERERERERVLEKQAKRKKWTRKTATNNKHNIIIRI